MKIITMQDRMRAVYERVLSHFVKLKLNKGTQSYVAQFKANFESINPSTHSIDDFYGITGIKIKMFVCVRCAQTCERVLSIDQNGTSQHYCEVCTERALRAYDKIEERNDENHWEPFYFDSNGAWGFAQTPEAWNAVKEKWKDYYCVLIATGKPDDIYDAYCYQTPVTGFLCFGSHIKHSETCITLREFFLRNNMSLTS